MVEDDDSPKNISINSPFENVLKSSGYILEMVGIFAAISVVFSSDLVSNSPILKYIGIKINQRFS
jgi:hypothetical protein